MKYKQALVSPQFPSTILVRVYFGRICCVLFTMFCTRVCWTKWNL